MANVKRKTYLHFLFISHVCDKIPSPVVGSLHVSVRQPSLRLRLMPSMEEKIDEEKPQKQKKKTGSLVILLIHWIKLC